MAVISQTSVASQKAGNIWYFGYNAGIDFNVSPPALLTNGSLSTIEGCATICNNNGSLLFYTDGTTIYDKTHNLMAGGTGLTGNESSTQSGIIVSNPDSGNIYYVFTTQGFGTLAFSTVDTALNSGKGAVRTKNIALMSPGTEKLTAVKHGNSQDVWVISHQTNSDSFFVYRVTKNGVNKTPVISEAGSRLKGISPGYLKVSPDGKWLVCTDYQGKVELFDFNSATGVISNPQVLIDDNEYYGVEYSPSGRYLYMVRADFGQDESYVFQFDLEAGNLSAIIASKVQIAHITKGIDKYTPGALQLAPDGRIYMALYSSCPYLSVINEPEKKGLACGFKINGFMLAPGHSSSWGLPSFNQSFFRPRSFSFRKQCYHDSTMFAMNDTMGLDSVRWSFGDINSGTSNTSKQFNPWHIFSLPGDYTVKLKVYRAKNPAPDSVSALVTISHVAPFNLGKDTTLCEGTPCKYQLTIPSATFLWQDGSTLSSYIVTKAGKYHVTATSGLCSSADTVVVSYHPKPVINLGRDTVLCDNQHMKLQVNAPGADFLWHDGNTSSSVNVSPPGGTYWVKVTDGSCVVSDTVNIVFETTPHVELGKDTQLCGTKLLLDVSQPGCTYLWNDGLQVPSRLIDSSGLYRVTVSRLICSKTDSIMVNYLATPVVDLGPDTLVCEHFSKVLELKIPFATFLWQDGSTSNKMTVKGPGKYSVTVTNICGTMKDSVTYSYVSTPCALYVPNAFTPNGNNLNEVFLPSGYGIRVTELTIYNRWGEVVFAEKGPAKGWDGNYSGGPAQSGVYLWRIRYEIDEDGYTVIEEAAGKVALIR